MFLLLVLVFVLPPGRASGGDPVSLVEPGDNNSRVGNGQRDRSLVGWAVLIAQHTKIVVPMLISYQRESIDLTYSAPI